MIMNSVAMTLILLVFLSGCSLLNHMNQIMTLSDYSRDKDAQERVMTSINAHYHALTAAIRSGEIKKYSDQKDIRKVFGEPILIKGIEYQGQRQEQWLYRQGLPTRAKDKVYLYFDAHGRLFKYEQENIPWSW